MGKASAPKHKLLPDYMAPHPRRQFSSHHNKVQPRIFSITFHQTLSVLYKVHILDLRASGILGSVWL